MTVLRTPDDRFEGLPGFPFEPHYCEIEDAELGPLRIHYVDEGQAHGPVVLCLHGEPTWSYLYRKMIPVFAEAGLRTVAPDLVGFGRSDKPSERSDYSYARHVRWMKDWLVAMGLCNVTLLGQDWGGLIGLRMVAELPERFARFSLSNTGLPTGEHPINEAFHKWRAFSQEDPEFDTGYIVNLFGHGDLTEAEIEAYRAPFPDERYAAGPRVMPTLVRRPANIAVTGAGGRVVADALRVKTSVGVAIWPAHADDFDGLLGGGDDGLVARSGLGWLLLFLLLLVAMLLLAIQALAWLLRGGRLGRDTQEQGR